MPQNPDFSHKMMGFDGGGLGLTSATLRCTSKAHGSLPWAFAVYRKSKQKCYEFGLSLAQPCALRAVALTVHLELLCNKEAVEP